MKAIGRRLPQLVLGLVLFGVGLGFIVRAGYGQGPWTVFHQGLANHTPLTIGAATVVTGAVVLLVVVALREPIGVGTLANVAVIGPATDATLALVDEPGSTAARVALMLAAPLVVALGSGLYLGVGLGPGPRDGVMTGLNVRGVSVWRARLMIEATAFAIGMLLGGTVGIGTVWWLLMIGPAVQVMLGQFSRGPIESRWTDVLGHRVPIRPGGYSAQRRADGPFGESGGGPGTT